MRRLNFAMVLLVAVCASEPALAGIVTTGALQWQVADGGNGHYYELVMPDAPQSTADNFSWFDARDAAAASQFNGAFGHLATITSFGEDEFLRTTFEGNIQIRDFPHGLPGDFVWIGLTDQDSEGQYTWITGEAFSYSHWASTEPNNLGDEDFVHIWRRYENGNNDGWSWNDKNPGPFLPDSRWGYIVEYDGPFTAPVPEPASFAIWGSIGLFGVAICWRRKRMHAVAA